MIETYWRVMDSKFRAVRNVFFGLSAMLLFVQAASLPAQQIPASELPPPGIDTGLEGKYDPQNGIAQLIRDKSAESAVSKIFEDDRVLVFVRYAPDHAPYAGLVGHVADPATARAWIAYDLGDRDTTLIGRAPDRVPYRYDEARRAVIPIGKVPPEIPNVRVSQRFARSLDGTSVPYFVIHRSDLDLAHPQPAVLTGNRGFCAMNPFWRPAPDKN